MATVTVNDSNVYISSAALSPQSVKTGGSFKLSVGMDACTEVLGAKAVCPSVPESSIDTWSCTIIDDGPFDPPPYEIKIPKGAEQAIVGYNINSGGNPIGDTYTFNIRVRFGASTLSTFKKVKCTAYAASLSQNVYGLYSDWKSDEIILSADEKSCTFTPTITTSAYRINGAAIAFRSGDSSYSTFPCDVTMYVFDVSPADMVLIDSDGALLRTK